MKFQKKFGQTKPTIPTASLPDVIFGNAEYIMMEMGENNPYKE
ncbi:hypothetical protein JGI16_12091, partial [Candidatus Kryptonium thompsonii]